MDLREIDFGQDAPLRDFPPPPMFGYSKRITIDRSLVGEPSTTSLANYPLLVSVVDRDLRQRESGGKVVAGQAIQVYFEARTTETCGGPAPCALDHEIEAHDPETGELVAWVRVPVLNGPRSADKTVIHLRYGGAEPPARAPARHAVWDGFSAVWHFSPTDLLGTLESQDSTRNENHGPPSGSFQPRTSAGLIANSVTFQRGPIYIMDHESLDLSTTGYLSLWFSRPSGWALSKGPRTRNDPGGVNYAVLALGEVVHAMQLQMRSGSQEFSAGGGFPRRDAGSAAFYHLAAVWEQGMLSLYDDGVLVGPPQALPFTPAPNDVALMIGAAWGERDLSGSFTGVYGGVMDELRISRTPRTAAWIQTDVRNQRDPGSFIQLGPEELVAAP
jgi:MSHA biogenesis protein MshQ